MGLQQPSSRYRLSKHRMLPQFGGKREPFRASVGPAANGHEPELTSGAASVGEREELGSRALGGAESPTHVIDPGAPGRTAANPPGLAPQQHRRVRLWNFLQQSPFSGERVQGLRSLFARFKRSSTEGFRIVPRPSPMVQGELTLDSVKVVRNDLTDSDLEIIPARSTKPASGNPFARRETEGVSQENPLAAVPVNPGSSDSGR